MTDMVARQAQAIDRAAIIYIEAQLETQERKYPWLAEKIGMPYPTLYNYFRKDRAIRMGDLVNMFSALRIEPDVGMREIVKIAEELDADEVDDEQ